MTTLTALTLCGCDPHYLLARSLQEYFNSTLVTPLGSNHNTVYKCLFNKVLKARSLTGETI